jgi:YfiH family protein
VTAGPGSIRIDTHRGRAQVRFTTRADGDLNAAIVAPDVLGRRWHAVADRPVVWLAEVHGAHVVHLDGADPTGTTGDAIVTGDLRRAVGIWVGDCAPVAFIADEGVVGAAHVGWRGLLAGVVGQTVTALRTLGGATIHAVIGPCIHAECYEFGVDDIERLATHFGPAVAGTTAWGTPALDLPAALRAGLRMAGVATVDAAAPCTACDGRFWSHRARGERERHGMAVWLEETAA